MSDKAFIKSLHERDARVVQRERSNFLDVMRREAAKLSNQDANVTPFEGAMMLVKAVEAALEK